MISVLPKFVRHHGATNDSELLDKAIWRRFDRSPTIPMPEEERMLLLERHLGKLKKDLRSDTIVFISHKTKDVSAADICKLCEHIKRQILLNPDTNANIIALTKFFKVPRLESREEKIAICKSLKKEFNELTQRGISQITQISLASVSRYLSN